MSFLKLTVSTLALAAVSATSAAAREQVHIAGSSTVLPYASIVAEAFNENFYFPTPVVESGGSSAGLKRFCEGVGDTTIDIANASRQIKVNELKTCVKNGVTDIIEVRIGYDGIVFASDVDGNTFDFTPADWYRAISETLVIEGQIVANPYTMWNEVNSDFPAQAIQTYVPGTKHGTREVFEDKVMLVGCEEAGDLKAYLEAATGDTDKAKKKAAEKICISLRKDGRSVDIDGDYTETLARIQSNKDGIGVFGLAFYENNTDKLQVANMSNIEPTVESIASGEYPVSRPLFFYIKKAHIGVIPGLKEFAEFFIADEVAGPDGPLAEYGLVADPELTRIQEIVADEVVLDIDR